MENKISTMEAKIEELARDVRHSKWIYVSGTILSLTLTALRFFIPLPQQPAPAANTNSVNIGDATPTTTTQRDFLTVHEVAAREGLSARTITEYISAGRIDPPPTRNGTRPWAIAADYRILPLTADNSGGE
jgi:hypothetical protein